MKRLLLLAALLLAAPAVATAQEPGQSPKTCTAVYGDSFATFRNADPKARAAFGGRALGVKWTEKDGGSLEPLPSTRFEISRNGALVDTSPSLRGPPAPGGGSIVRVPIGASSSVGTFLLTPQRTPGAASAAREPCTFTFAADEKTLLGDAFALRTDFLEGSKSDAIGVRFDLRSDLTALFPAIATTGLEAEFRLNGEISSEDKAESFHSQVAASVTGSRRWVVGRLPVGVYVTPIKVEADKDFNTIDYVAQAGVLFEVPFTRRLAYGLQSALGGCDYEVYPCTTDAMLAYVGYAQVESIDRPANARKNKSRPEADVIYDFPLSNSWAISTRYQWYGASDTEADSDNFSAGLAYYLNCPRRAAFTIDYQKGEISPTFDDIEAVRIGFRTLLGNPSRNSETRGVNPKECG